jgi:Tol biopolymer transport system component
MAALAALLALPALAAKDEVELISRATGGVAANGASISPSMSADGHFVAFASVADNLSDADNNTWTNLFVRDTTTAATRLVNPSSGPVPRIFHHVNPSLSDDGRFIAYEIDVDGTSPFEPTHVSRRDLDTDVVAQVDIVAVQFGTPGEGSGPSISADGRLVAFVSTGALASGNASAAEDVYVRDVVAGTTELVSRAPGPGGAGGNDASFAPSISPDGRFVAFQSNATNLSDDDLDPTTDVFVRDLVDQTTTLVSRASGLGPAGDDDSTGASISADGNRVAFVSGAGNLTPDTRSVSSSGDVFVRDLTAQTTTLASRAPGATGAVADLTSRDPAISRDGRSVVFSSDATNLSDADGDGVQDVFVRDLSTATTTLVSRAAGAGGAGADDQAGAPAISGDGRFVAFSSLADNLSGVDSNVVENVFRRDVLGAPPALLPPAVVPPVVTTAKPARCAGVRATIVGTARRNVIRGTFKRDVIAALGGDDVVRGLGGNDLICLGAGNDRGLGGAGADRILGGPGRDTLLGGPGLDRLLGQAGRDRARGGLGRDVCAVEARAAC